MSKFSVITKDESIGVLNKNIFNDLFISTYFCVKECKTGHTHCSAVLMVSHLHASVLITALYVGGFFLSENGLFCVCIL